MSEQGSDTRIRANFPLTPEVPKSGTYNELLRLIKTNFDRGIILRSFTALAGSSSFGHVFIIWENGEYLAYQITNLDSSTLFSIG